MKGLKEWQPQYRPHRIFTELDYTVYRTKFRSAYRIFLSCQALAKNIYKMLYLFT